MILLCAENNTPTSVFKQLPGVEIVHDDPSSLQCVLQQLEKDGTVVEAVIVSPEFISKLLTAYFKR